MVILLGRQGSTLTQALIEQMLPTRDLLVRNPTFHLQKAWHLMAPNDSTPTPAGTAGRKTPLGTVRFGGQASAVKFQRGRNVSFNADQTQKAPDVLSFRVAPGDGKVETVEVRGVFVRGTIKDGDIVDIVDGERKGDVYRTKKVWNFTRSSAITETLLGALRRRS